MSLQWFQGLASALRGGPVGEETFTQNGRVCRRRSAKTSLPQAIQVDPRRSLLGEVEEVIGGFKRHGPGGNQSIGEDGPTVIEDGFAPPAAKRARRATAQETGASPRRGPVGNTAEGRSEEEALAAGLPEHLLGGAGPEEGEDARSLANDIAIARAALGRAAPARSEASDLPIQLAEQGVRAAQLELQLAEHKLRLAQRDAQVAELQELMRLLVSYNSQLTQQLEALGTVDGERTLAPPIPETQSKLLQAVPKAPPMPDVATPDGGSVELIDLSAEQELADRSRAAEDVLLRQARQALAAKDGAPPAGGRPLLRLAAKGAPALPPGSLEPFTPPVEVDDDGVPGAGSVETSPMASLNRTASPLHSWIVACSQGMLNRHHGAQHCLMDLQKFMAGATFAGPYKKPPGPVDLEGRLFDLHTVVVNFSCVGAFYAKQVLASAGEEGLSPPAFDWEGVRRCVQHLHDEMDMKVVGVAPEELLGADNEGGDPNCLPDDVRDLCQEIVSPPVWDDGADVRVASERMTIRSAYERNCQFMDNHEYKEVLQGIGKWATDKEIMWIAHCHEWLRMGFFFDSELGFFETLDGNVNFSKKFPKVA